MPTTTTQGPDTTDSPPQANVEANAEANVEANPEPRPEPELEPGRDPSSHAGTGPSLGDESEPDLEVVEDLLVEEVSIDGMCGVY